MNSPMIHETPLSELLENPNRTAVLPIGDIPPLLAKLAALQTALLTRLMATATSPPSPSRSDQPEDDRLLTVEEAAGRLQVEVQWLYRHHAKLPFSKPLSRKCLRFSEAGLRKWLASKRS